MTLSNKRNNLTKCILVMKGEEELSVCHPQTLQKDVPRGTNVQFTQEIGGGVRKMPDVLREHLHSGRRFFILSVSLA